MLDKTDGEGQGAESKVPVSPDATGGQPPPSPAVPETPHEMLMAGIAAVDAAAEAETPAGDATGAEVAVSVPTEGAEGTPAGETPPPGEKAPVPAAGAEAPPTVESLAAEIATLNKRVPGFQTALNERQAELDDARALLAQRDVRVDALLQLVEEGIEEEARPAFRQNFAERVNQAQGQAMAQTQAQGLARSLDGYLDRLEKAGMKLEGRNAVERVISAANQGIDIGANSQTPHEGLLRMADAVSQYEAKARVDALEQEVKDLKQQQVTDKKTNKRHQIQNDMAGGGGATNLGGVGGPQVDRDAMSPHQLLELGVEARKASGE